MLAPLTDSDPRVVGPYHLHNRIGAGGMGIVYLGFGPDDRPVAVKVPNVLHAADPEFRARFRAEVSAARGVRGPSVARVIDAEVNGPTPWLATEYVQGPTLHAAVNENGPLGDQQLDALAVGLARALVAIHEAGVVHRDLKPANIVMSWEGPKVIDFGVARSADYSGVTRAGERVGTIAWMAPEQIDGHTAGPAADVFAWANCVAFAATGRRSFRGDSQEIVALQIRSAPPGLDGVPERLIRPLRAALEKAPECRPDARELLEMLTGRGMGSEAGRPPTGPTVNGMDETRRTGPPWPGTGPPPVIPHSSGPRHHSLPGSTAHDTPAHSASASSASASSASTHSTSTHSTSTHSTSIGGASVGGASAGGASAGDASAGGASAGADPIGSDRRRLAAPVVLALLVAAGLTGAGGLGAAAAGAGQELTGPVGAALVAAVCAQVLAPARGRRALITVLAAAVGGAAGLVLARIIDLDPPGPVLTELGSACLLAVVYAVVLAGERNRTDAGQASADAGRTDPHPATAAVGSAPASSSSRDGPAGSSHGGPAEV